MDMGAKIPPEGKEPAPVPAPRETGAAASARGSAADAPAGGERRRETDAPPAEQQVRGPFHWLTRLKPASLVTRIILINLAGLVILVGGILYFNQSRESLIDARVQSLMTQARIMAAAVASAASIDTGEIVIDPDKLIEQTGEEPQTLDSFGQLDFLIRPEQAGPVLRRLVKDTETIARIYDRDGILSVDSRHVYGSGGILRLDLPSLTRPEESWWRKAWRQVNEWLFAHDYPLQKEYGLENGKDFPEVTASLNGASVSVVRVNKKGEIIVTVAVPIQRYKAVLGSLVLSTRGGEIDKVLRSERRIVLFTFLVAGLVALLLSVSLASQIAEPIRRLAAAAEKVRRGVDNRVEIPDFGHRKDEIGHLSGALRDMTRALYDRIDAIEAFAADVAHELKNPLTSLRSAVETLHFAKTEEQRQRLVKIVTDDVKRLDRLISDISDASRLDAELARSHARPVDLRHLLETMVDLANQTARKGEARVELLVEEPPSSGRRRNVWKVMGHDTRLAQVVRNLLANARSFSPPDGVIKVKLRRLGRHVEFTVEDSGPGIPPDNLEKIFKRFYTDRPAEHFGENSGLGLSISRQIVEAHNGRIWAANIPCGESSGDICGARFTVRLPATRAGRKNAAQERGKK